MGLRSTVFALRRYIKNFEHNDNIPHVLYIKYDGIKTGYMYLWYMANTLTFRQIANLFGGSISGAWNSIARCTKFFISVAEQTIKQF